MNEVILHGDTEAAVIQLLSSETIVTILVPSTNISASLIGYSSGSRWIEISLEGGTYTFPKFYRPRIDIYVYASNRSDAIDICNAITGSLTKQMGEPTVRQGTRIIDVKVENGWARVPDKETDSPRYIGGFRLTVAP